MKLAFAFAAVLAVASAQFAGLDSSDRRQGPTTPPALRLVANSDQEANIIRNDNVASPDGSYGYTVETDNGIYAEAQGYPRDFGGNPPIVPVVAQGAFYWVAPDGQKIGIKYIADENGYKPYGEAIPTSPPVPALIARALEYLARNAAKK